MFFSIFFNGRQFLNCDHSAFFAFTTMLPGQNKGFLILFTHCSNQQSEAIIGLNGGYFVAFMTALHH